LVWDEEYENIVSSKILYITSSLPSLTLTFIYREIIALEKLGVQIDIVSMNRPNIENVSGQARPFLNRILYMDQIGLHRQVAALVAVLFAQPRRFAKMLLVLLQARPRAGVRDFARLSYHFISAAYLFRQMRSSGHVQIHAHFVSGPSSIAMFLSGLSGVPFSFTMHGSQIYIDPLGLVAKLDRCRFAVSVSNYHRQYVLNTYGDAHSEKLRVVHCGLEMEQFPPPIRQGRSNGPFRILGVGRLVEVKGFEYLLRACAELKKRQMDYLCRIVGDGERRDSLQKLAVDLGIEDCVRFEGAQHQSELAAYYSSSDVFCLPCVVGSDGSRDGLPIVLMEAMVWELPVVSSQLVGIPELVENYQHGILVAPGNVDGLADAIIYVHENPDEVADWGRAGREKIAESFNVISSASELKELFFGGDPSEGLRA
jgi:glycosyltransferase involved in cell wall biosynthesis